MSEVTITGLTKQYGDVVAVDDLDLQVNDGELTTLLGPSGCGKTTTLRCIAGLERPTKGRITIGDNIVTDIDQGIFVPPQNRDIGFIFQSFDVWPHLNVFDNIAYPLRIKDFSKAEIEEKVDEVLELANIRELKTKDAVDLSGGQQARVSICRALVSEPSVLLCDEPLTGLDRNLRNKLRVEIRRIQTELGISTVYVTHSQPESMAISDKICVMNTSGKIEQMGTSEQIYNQPVSEYIFDFFGDSVILDGKIVDSTVVDTSIGRMACDASEYETGTNVSVGVRPIDIQITNGDGSNPGGNTYAARVLNAVFLGDYFDLDLEIDGTVLRAHPKELPSELTDGDTVHVRIDGDDVILLEARP